MENELLNLSIRTSLFTFLTIAVIIHIAHIVLSLIKPYIIRNMKDISLKYTQNIYLTAYIFLKNILLNLSLAIYIITFIFNIVNNNLFNNINLLWAEIGIIILLAYTISRIFIDYSHNFILKIVAIGLNILSFLFILFSYVPIVMNY